MSQKIVIAIDGVTASGKGTVSQLVAKTLGFEYLDSGKIYRALAYLIQQAEQKDESSLVSQAIKVASSLDLSFDDSSEQAMSINGEKVLFESLEHPRISSLASQVAPIKEVREILLDMQRKFVFKKDIKGLVADGRDMGTVVFPDATLKVFMEADLDLRASRRYKQLEQNKEITYQQIYNEIEKRDERDYNRKHGPLKKSKDALVLSSNTLTPFDLTQVIIRAFNDKIRDFSRIEK